MAVDSLNVRRLPLRRFEGVDSNQILEQLHVRQGQYGIRQLWDNSLKIPPKHMEYLFAACRDLSACVRQETVLLLKRYIWELSKGKGKGRQRYSLQVVILTCANLAAKYWNGTIGEQQLHRLSSNAFTRKDFIEAEVEVLSVLHCDVHWDGVLLIEWVSCCLFLCQELLAKPSDLDIIMDIATQLMDALFFQDHLMSQYLPSQLAAAILHAAVQLCTKSFQEYKFCLRVNHLCRVADGDVSSLSERLLQGIVGQQCAELVFEGAQSDDLAGPMALTDADRDEL